MIHSVLRGRKIGLGHVEGVRSFAHGLAYPTNLHEYRECREFGRVLSEFEREVLSYPRGFARIWREAVKSIGRRALRLGNFIFSMGNSYETSLLTLEFNNTNIANVGDATGLRGSSTAGSFYIALHTGDPGEAGDQTSSECSFTSYVRQAVARSGAGWTVAGNQVSNTSLISFPQNTGADQTATHFSIGLASAGASVNARYGPLVNSGAVWQPFTATAADVITVPGHTFIVGDRIVLVEAYDSTIATGITRGTVYWVKTVATNDITISTTSGGATLDITAAGSGVCVEALPLVVRGGIDSVQFAANTLVAKID